ncbi:TetR/AcrR family transcriptional regulator [Clostridium algoriphilum]|uniref:TetR/AcrR family transcriptional regulator n=1 Tax=Clostridium algoriphilum TaxID=198347 RepID=UPI001CF2F202|nr:TetR/AcrR family transcriptional regulator [Clostridium algoriphilum]MCB2294401.1 TetR/AcrR family transcriptional regulator [Clostridium algoriphilum]
MAKITNRSKQAETTKRKIYECGVRLIRIHGFDGVTVDQIAKEAGVSVGTYYYYFASKFELFSEIFKQADEYFLKEVKGHIKAEDFRGQITEFFEKYAEFNCLNGLEMVKKLYTSDNKMFNIKGRIMQKILEDIIENGQIKGHISTRENSTEITRIFFVVARGIVFEWCLLDGVMDLKSEMNKIIASMVEGYMLNN